MKGERFRMIGADAAKDYRVGFGLTLLGALIITPDALLVRLIGADAWTMVFWRGVTVPTVFLTFLLIVAGPTWLLNTIRSAGRDGIGVAFAYAAVSISFMIALERTTVASTLVILAASPFFAALLSRLLLRERVPAPTWMAMSAGFLGIGVVMSEGLVSTYSSASLEGDLAALVAAFMLAASFVLIRRRKDVNMVPATALGGYMGALIAFPMATPLVVLGDHFWLLALKCGVILPLSFGLIALGPRRLPAPEVGLLMLLETVVGPLWVWGFLGESPGTLALAGGAMVVGALAVHSIWRMRERASVAAA
jgi:drug/metabolite transporter (DMT)-like permease